MHAGKTAPKHSEILTEQEDWTTIDESMTSHHSISWDLYTHMLKGYG
jgi:hypothetical protein